MSIPRLTAENSILVVVDVQDKLLAKMPAAAELVEANGFLLDVANVLGVPVKATEQYPKGLGPTAATLARRLPPNPPAKTAFSCCGVAGFLDELWLGGRQSVVLTGMEAHVCVAQTALDLLAAGMRVFLPVDAVGSRYAIDRETAFLRLGGAGAVLTTAEAVAFEWVGDAAHPQFKTVSRLVIDRKRG